MNDIIGYIAAVLVTVAYIPQLYKIIKTRSAKDVSLGMYLVMLSGIVAWLVYGILIVSYPIIAANALTAVFVSAILIFKIKTKQ